MFLLVGCLAFSENISEVQAAKWYSCRDTKLDYKKGSGGLYGTGKTLTSKATSKTKYYVGDWRKASTLGVMGMYHTSRYKKAKFLRQTSKSEYTKNNGGMSYIKISKGKIQTAVTGIVFAL